MWPKRAQVTQAKCDLKTLKPRRSTECFANKATVQPCLLKASQKRDKFYHKDHCWNYLNVVFLIFFLKAQLGLLNHKHPKERSFQRGKRVF